MKCVAIMGATATGKSTVAIELARRFTGEIVSMDSRQVYRGLDIGTGKVTREQRLAVPHHLLDVLDPTEHSSAGGHARMAARAIDEIVARGALPFLVGGTGLYFRALLLGLIDVTIPDDERHRIRRAFEGRATDDLFAVLRSSDPDRAADISPNDRVRIVRALELITFTGRRVTDLFRESRRAAARYDVISFVLTMPRPALRDRIARRTGELFEAGWVDEVRRLLDGGLTRENPGMQSLGYGEIASAIAAGEPPEKAVERVTTATQQYAKRQETFFRGLKGGRWVDVSVEGYEASMADAIAEHCGT